MRNLRSAPVARTVWIAVLALGLWLLPAAIATAAPRSSDDLLIPSAGWHGRPIEKSHEHRPTRLAATDTAIRGWSAGPVSLGAGTRQPSGSARVREVQRRLRRLGYRTGGVDGVYGPRTRAAVAWFQKKHGMPVDGRASLATVRHLRYRVTAPSTPAPGPAPAPTAASTTERPAAPPVAPVERVPAVAAEEDDTRWWLVAGLALAVALVALGALLATGFGTDRKRIAVRLPATPPAPGRPRAVGYVRLSPDAQSASFHAQAAAIETGCAARGLELKVLVSDMDPAAGGEGDQAGLRFALEQLEEGDVDRLVVSRADHLARTASEFWRLAISLGRSDAGIVVLDRDLDTARPGDVAAAGTMVLDRPARPAPPPRMGDPEPLKRHIAAMRGDGLSPWDIAVALNEEHVPPPRGSEWELAGVQAALGDPGEDRDLWRDSDA
jgi:peptidoglycan hydrolase-like protein with peptidoglycan-binding domain